MRSLLKDGLMPALREDVPLLRVFLRAMNLLEPPGDLMQNPVVMQGLLASYARRDQREKDGARPVARGDARALRRGVVGTSGATPDSGPARFDVRTRPADRDDSRRIQSASGIEKAIAFPFILWPIVKQWLLVGMHSGNGSLDERLVDNREVNMRSPARLWNRDALGLASVGVLVGASCSWARHRRGPRGAPMRETRSTPPSPPGAHSRSRSSTGPRRWTWRLPPATSSSTTARRW